MARQTINIGTTANDGSGTELRTGGVMINENFIELYAFKDGFTFTSAELSAVIRKILTPYSYTSYLPIDSPFTTASITADTETKLLLPTTIKSSNGWAVTDTGGGNMALTYSGLTTEKFKVFMTTSIVSQQNNNVMDFMMYKNGVQETGTIAEIKIGSGGDVGEVSLMGEFTATADDYIELWVNTSVNGTLTFSKTSIMIIELN